MPIYQLPLIESKTVARQTIEYTFAKPDGFQFISGQYGGFSLIDPDTKLLITRRFSLLSAPHESVLRIVMRIQPSHFKRLLALLRPGDVIKFAGPSGAFTLHNELDRPAVFIAGGIGIAPFYSIIQHITHHTLPRAIAILYGNNTLEDATYYHDLTQLAKTSPFFKFIPVIQHKEENWIGETGMITASIIKKHIDVYLLPPIFYVCGSEMMVGALKRTLLIDMNIAATDIRVEEFPGY